MPSNPHFNRFDILEAWCLHLAENHGGQGTHAYRRLSKILTYFRPGLVLTDKGVAALTENGRAIYNRLAEEG